MMGTRAMVLIGWWRWVSNFRSGIGFGLPAVGGQGLRDMDGWVLMGFTLLATGGHGPFRWWTRCAALPGVIWVRCQTPWIAADDEDDEMTWQINAFPFVWVGPISRSDPRRSYAGRQQVGEDGAPEVGAPMVYLQWCTCGIEDTSASPSSRHLWLHKLDNASQHELRCLCLRILNFSSGTVVRKPKNPSINSNDDDSIEGNDGDLTPCPKNPPINGIDRELTRLTTATTKVGQHSYLMGSGEVYLHWSRIVTEIGKTWEDSAKDPDDGGNEKVLRRADETQLCSLEPELRRKLSELFRVLV
ncbi:hypothetical protein ACLOJK_038695 [Asimina triloba]